MLKKKKKNNVCLLCRIIFFLCILYYISDYIAEFSYKRIIKIYCWGHCGYRWKNIYIFYGIYDKTCMISIQNKFFISWFIILSLFYPYSLPLLIYLIIFFALFRVFIFAYNCRRTYCTWVPSILVLFVHPLETRIMIFKYEGTRLIT